MKWLTFGKIAPLDHKVLDNPMKGWVLVVQGFVRHCTHSLLPWNSKGNNEESATFMVQCVPVKLHMCKMCAKDTQIDQRPQKKACQLSLLHVCKTFMSHGQVFHINTDIHWYIWVNTGSGNGLLPDDTTPLPDSMTYHQQCPVAFIWRHHHKRRSEDTNQLNKTENFKNSKTFCFFCTCHAMTAKLLCGSFHEQNFIAIILLKFGSEPNKITIEFALG